MTSWRGEEDTGESPRRRVFPFVTSNSHKYGEASYILEKYGIELKMLRLKKLEIQSSSLKKVAAFSAQDAFATLRRDLIVEDSGLFVDALNGFPGSYSSYVYRSIGVQGVLTLMEKVAARKASFRSVVAYVDQNGALSFFAGATNGVITDFARGVNGFGFDPIFTPSGSSRTFAEMKIDEKNRFSHRAKAFNRFAKHVWRRRE